MKGNLLFQFDLGPVQEFVAQARRTRDFWSGSFILSYLSLVAIETTRQQKSEILSPYVPEEIRRLVREGGRKAEVKQLGVTNRFSALVPADFQPQQVVSAVQQVWYDLAQLIWQKDFGDSYKTSPTYEIFERQVKSFWNCTWTLSEVTDNTSYLDQRKNWRHHFLPDEGGVKCALIPGLQELSGLPRSGRELKDFWSKLRQGKEENDFSDEEYLSAPAYIKRRFSRFFEEFRSEPLPGLSFRGWQLETAAPSTAFMAASEWLATILRATDEKPLPELKELAEVYKNESKPQKLRHLEEANQKQQLPLNSLEGEDLYLDSLEAKIRRATAGTEKLKQKKAALENLQRALKKRSLPAAPGTFYALLAMDGDRMGARQAENRQQMSHSLAQFAKQVEEIVEAYGGFLIYAGGDDVLAVFSKSQALPCAHALNKAFRKTLADAGNKQATISAAVLFAHYKQPLTGIIRRVQELLKDVAKEKLNRDALAVTVLKPGGENLSWGRKWDSAFTPEGKLVHDKFTSKIASSGTAGASFLYNIRDTIQRFSADLRGRGAIPLKDHVNEATLKALIQGVLLQSEITRHLQNLPQLTDSAWTLCCEGQYFNSDNLIFCNFMADTFDRSEVRA